MPQKRYKVYDSYGNYLRTFDSYQAASAYLTMCGRYDWEIKEYKLTNY